MSERDLPIAEINKLKAGADNYRAYVGPPGRFDFMSLSQIGILFYFGLKESDMILDFGCGSLRAGRMLIPFLLEGNYFGIEPNKWLVDDGIDRELGRDAISIKKPSFAHNDDFDCSVFNEKFDFIMAQSIVTHAGPELACKLFTSASKSLKKDGILLFSYLPGSGVGMPKEGWSYPANISYSPDAMHTLLNDVGLFSVEIPWYHPGAKWIAASIDPERLPTNDELSLLGGRPVQRVMA